MEIKHFIKLTTLTLGLALYCLLLTASIQAKTTQDDFSCTVVSEIPQLECEALVDIYNSTDGPNWVQKDGWLTTTTPCSWYGMTCDDGSVAELDLNNNFDGNGLAGAVPATIENLMNLKMLDLSYNQLSSLPAEIGNLSALTRLWLSSNQLSSLPAEVGNLSSLTTLWLSSNQLNDIPAEIWSLTNLTWLKLDSNLLSSIPAKVGNLSNLEYLYLSSNQLSNIPSEIWTLTNLTRLELGSNLLTDIPTEIGNLSNLDYLHLGANRLSSIPAEIGNLSNLRHLSLHSNQLSSVPTEISNLSNLRSLSLFSNQLNSVPTVIGDLSNLENLWLSSNQLTSLPVQIGNLSNLTRLELRHNQLSNLPTEIGRLSNLTILTLSSNQLSSLPSEIGNLSNLETLYLSINQLNTLPTNLVNLTNLTHLSLGVNHLDVTDTALLAWMNANDPDWANTQIVDTPTPTSTDTPTNTSTSTPTRIFTPTPTDTSISTPTATFTPVPTDIPTSTSTDTNTPIPPTTISIPTPTRANTVTAPESGGSDDFCTQANQVNSGDLSEESQFETAFDVDWFTFQGIADTPYRIDVEIPSGSSADVNLELYPECNQVPVDNWIESFSPSVELDFTPETDGSVYLRLTNADDSIGGPHLRYQLSVRQLNQESETGAVIIVAGRLKRSDRLQDNIYNTTDEVFSIFQEQGYTAENIFYLAPEPDEVSHYDAAATIANLGSAITSWAADRIKLPDVPDVLTIYMMDHGDIDLFYLDGPRAELLRPDQLDGWLDKLEADIPGIKINVIIEACHAGSFIQLPASISGPNRVIITSSDQENDAYASAEGAYFSDQFLTSLREGDNLFSGWSRAASVVEELFIIFPQRPWIDGNGNGIPNEREDFAAASLRGFAIAGTLDDTEKLWPPYIAQATAPENLEGNSALIRAEVRDDRAVGHVWAVIYPPSYEPQTSEESNELIEEDLETIVLKSQGDDQYQGRGYNFTESGVYRVVIHADDGDELLARPVVVEFDSAEVGGTFSRRHVYLPLISR